MAESAAAYSAVYEDIEPFFEWHTDDDFYVLVVMLPGFRRDQLKVQVTSTPILKISAQRQIGGNRWRRVYKEFPVPSDCDPNDPTAKFEGGTLKIKFPKLIITPSSKSPERDGDAEKNNNGAQLEDQAKPKSSDDQVSDKTQKVDEPAAKENDLTKEKGKTDEKNAVHHQEDHQEKAKSVDEDSGKTNQKEKEPAAAAASDDFSEEKGKIKNVVDEKKAVHQQDQEKAKSADQVSEKTSAVKQKEKEPPAAAEEARNGKQRTKNMNMSRLKTRLLDFSLSLRPSRADEQGDYSYDYKEAVADLVARLKKMTNLMSIMVVALFILAFVLYLKNAFKSSLEGSEQPEL